MAAKRLSRPFRMGSDAAPAYWTWIKADAENPDSHPGDDSSPGRSSAAERDPPELFPDGSKLKMPLPMLDRSPLSNFFLPGLILFLSSASGMPGRDFTFNGSRLWALRVPRWDRLR